MSQAAIWYLLLFAIGWISYPIAARIFSTYEDRGFAFSKTLGLVAVGTIHWLLTSFGLNVNTSAGVAFSVLVTASASAVVLYKDRTTIKFFTTPSAWIRTESIFVIGFVFMALVRSLNPDVSGTEKPMELAFINGIRQSSVFPPSDPWMSGYSISYYYFGYLLTSTLSLLSGVTGSVAFNLMIATIFALAGGSAFAIMKKMTAGLPIAAWKRSLISLSAPIFILVISNAEGFLEVLHSLGIGWGNGGGFWRWLNIKDLIDQPRQPYGWDPRFWFWWRASRVVTDLDVFGNAIEIIDEFPFFSFLLGDLHPHVLAIPVVLLLIGLAVEFFDRAGQAITENMAVFLRRQRSFLIVVGLVLGALGFTNTWDLPIYFGLFFILVVFFTLKKGIEPQHIKEVLISIGILLLAALIPYLPFYIAFSSQAGGFLPNIVNPTRTIQLWVMFLPLFVPVNLFLMAASHEKKTAWGKGLFIAAGLVLFLFVFSIALGLLIDLVSEGAGLNTFGARNFSALLTEGLVRRGQGSLTMVTLVVLVGLPLGLLLRKERNADMDDMAAALVLLAGLLIVAPEFVYLRDQFGTRMNTIFKFYYQAWILLALVSAYAVARLTMLRSKTLSAFAISLSVISFAIGLVYPAISLPQKLDLGRHGKGSEMSLDGSSQLERYTPDVIAAARWLELQPSAVIVEAVGGSYTEFARFSTFSGQSTVLGWPGHESQWRGSYDLIPGRESDIRVLYETDDPETARIILDRYQITYVIVSDLERSTYQVQFEKFDDFYPIVWENGSVRIYQAR